MSLVSVIMSVYNEKQDWLTESINSILNQTYLNLEFIIVLDNPENIELKNILNEYKLKDSRVKLLINEVNKGLVFSLNRALKECSGDYIARMDADDISHLDRIEKQLKYLEYNHLDLIGSNINLFKDASGVFHTTDKLLTHKYLKKMLSAGTIGIVHPTFFGKKEVFDKLNGYSMSLHTEDKEFLARVFCNSFNVGNTKEVLLDCRYNDQSVTKTNAIYVNKIGIYVTKVFNDCIIKGIYNFDEKYHEKIVVTDKEKDNFNKKQILMGEAREKLNNKKYIIAIYKIIKASFHSSSVFTSIKINLFLKIFKFLENIELKKR